MEVGILSWERDREVLGLISPGDSEACAPSLFSTIGDHSLKKKTPFFSYISPFVLFFTFLLFIGV